MLYTTILQKFCIALHNTKVESKKIYIWLWHVISSNPLNLLTDSPALSSTLKPCLNPKVRKIIKENVMNQSSIYFLVNYFESEVMKIKQAKKRVFVCFPLAAQPIETRIRYIVRCPSFSKALKSLRDNFRVASWLNELRCVLVDAEHPKLFDMRSISINKQFPENHFSNLIIFTRKLGEKN